VTSVGEKEEKTNTIQPPLLVFFSPSQYSCNVSILGGTDMYIVTSRFPKQHKHV